jgi:hypothetical protein
MNKVILLGIYLNWAYEKKKDYAWHYILEDKTEQKEKHFLNGNRTYGILERYTFILF